MPYCLPTHLRWHILTLLLLAMVSQPVRAQLYYLDVSRQPLHLPDRTVYVEQVLDGRPGQPVVGTVYRGLNNKPAAVLFRQGLAPELTAWMQQNLPHRPDDHAIVFCVRQLRVSEVMNGYTELASAELAADVYVHLSDGYHFVRSVAHHTNQRALESTALHAPHLAQLAKQCLMQLAAIDWGLAPRSPARTLSQLATDRPLGATRPAILRTASPRKGIYYSFAQFLANQPDTTAHLRLDTVQLKAQGWEGTWLLRPSMRDAAGGRVAPRAVWGISDGHQAYLRQHNVFCPLGRQSDFFTFVGAAPLDAAAANQRAQQYASTGGGLVGALAAGGIDDNTGLPMVYALDMRTGQAAPLLQAGQPQRTDTAYLYVYRPLEGLPEAQQLLLNDHVVGQLRPGQYLELTWPYFGHPVRLSLGTPGGPALLVVPNTAIANYIKLRPAKALTPWQLVPPRQGEAEVDALEKPRK
jgi:hypothetical protein